MTKYVKNTRHFNISHYYSHDIRSAAIVKIKNVWYAFKFVVCHWGRPCNVCCTYGVHHITYVRCVGACVCECVSVLHIMKMFGRLPKYISILGTSKWQRASEDMCICILPHANVVEARDSLHAIRYRNVFNFSLLIVVGVTAAAVAWYRIWIRLFAAHNRNVHIC